LFVRLAVNPNVGDRVQPLTRGGIEYIQAMRQYQSVEEIFLYVPDTGFDAPWSSKVDGVNYDGPAERSRRSRGTCAWQNPSSANSKI
jgi:hypothetical protein